MSDDAKLYQEALKVARTAYSLCKERLEKADNYFDRSKERAGMDQLESLFGESVKVPNFVKYKNMDEVLRALNLSKGVCIMPANIFNEKNFDPLRVVMQKASIVLNIYLIWRAFKGEWNCDPIRDYRKMRYVPCFRRENGEWVFSRVSVLVNTSQTFSEGAFPDSEMAEYVAKTFAKEYSDYLNVVYNYI